MALDVARVDRDGAAAVLRARLRGADVEPRGGSVSVIRGDARRGGDGFAVQLDRLAVGARLEFGVSLIFERLGVGLGQIGGVVLASEVGLGVGEVRAHLAQVAAPRTSRGVQRASDSNAAEEAPREGAGGLEGGDRVGGRGALHVGHLVPATGLAPFIAASARVSGSALRAIQSLRHPSQKTCPHDVCEHCAYSTRLWQILHWNSSTSASLVSTSPRGKPMAWTTKGEEGRSGRAGKQSTEGRGNRPTGWRGGGAGADATASRHAAAKTRETEARGDEPRRRVASTTRAGRSEARKARGRPAEKTR